MHIFATVVVSFLITCASAWGVYNYAPLSILETGEGGVLLGTSLTTINGGDTLSSSRTTINNNFTALNNGKIENSTSSVAAITTLSNLTTVGALSSGSLTTGFTVVNVPQGGTSSTTLSSNQILLGNGTGSIKTVTGLGTSGQCLVSNGAGLSPSFSSTCADQTINYAWSGNHNFTGTTRILNFHASSTSANPMTLNGLAFNTPSVRAASSTALLEDGSGGLTWNTLDGQEVAETPLNTAATSSVALINIPARRDLVCKIETSPMASDDVITIRFNNDTGNNYGDSVSLNFSATPSNSGPTSAFANVSGNSATTSSAYITLNIDNTASSTLAKAVDWIAVLRGGGATFRPNVARGVGTWNGTTQINRIDVYTQSAANFNSGVRITCTGKQD